MTMAFQFHSLSRMGFTGAGDGNTLWFYDDPEGDGASAMASGYFPDDLIGVMRPGDMVFLSGGPDMGQITYVSSAKGASIAVSAASTAAL